MTDGDSSHDPGSSTSHIISYEHANHAGIVARNDKLRLLFQRTELDLIPSFPTDRPCNMHLEYLTSGVYIYISPPPKKKMDKTTFVFFCIVGYWSNDHCELKIELNLPLNHFNCLYHGHTPKRG